MGKIFKNNFSLKLISILFAAAVWFFVLSETNPISTEYITVPIQFLNESGVYEQGLGFVNNDFNKDVLITVQGRRDDMGKVSDKDFSATVDYSSVMGSGTKTLPVSIESRALNVQIIKTSQKDIRVSFDFIQDRTFQVSVQASGTPKDGYQIIRNYPVSDTIMINGLKETLDQIASIVVNISVDGVDRDSTIEKNCTVYNAAGEEIVTLKGKYSAAVKIEVAKQVDVKPVITGVKSADIYDYTYSAVPKKVWVTASGDLLPSIMSLDTGNVDISKITADATVSTTLRIPEGIFLYNSDINVNIEIAIIPFSSISFKISPGQINIVNSQSQTYAAEILTAELVIELKGVKSELDQITIEKLSPAINVSSLIEGTQNVPVSFRLPSNVELKGNYFVEVKINKK